MQESFIMLLEQDWMSLNGPKITCDVIHPNSSCSYELVVKMIKVMKRSYKMYTFLHLILFLLKFKKFKRQDRLKSGLLRTLKNFIGSLFFMSWLAGGMKLSICYLNRIKFFLDWRAATILALTASTSIYFQDKSRRGEIGYFVVVRSLRSLYLLIKKRTNINLTHERQGMFILIFGVLGYLFFQGPKSLKNRYFLEKMWGNA